MLVFIHIPKTAGTTLRQVAEAHYGKGKILSVYGDAIPRAEQFVQGQNLNNIEMVRGHIAFGVHNVINEPCTYITILRHPLERLASLYLYIRKDHGHFAYENVSQMSFRQFVFSGVTAETDNGQVRQLCGIEEFKQVPYAKHQTPFGFCGPNERELALDNLKSMFSVIGTQEMFDAFLVDMHETHGWTIPKQTPRVNTTKSADLVAQLGPKTVKDILTLNVHDLALWDWASRQGGQR